jgi:hypothetical protein
VLGCDSVLDLDGDVLGTPTDTHDAEARCRELKQLTKIDAVQAAMDQNGLHHSTGRDRTECAGVAELRSQSGPGQDHARPTVSGPGTRPPRMLGTYSGAPHIALFRR